MQTDLQPTIIVLDSRGFSTVYPAALLVYCHIVEKKSHCFNGRSQAAAVAVKKKKSKKKL